MRINNRAVKMYLNEKLKEEITFQKSRTEEIDIQQSKEIIKSIQSAMNNTEVQSLINEYNRLIGELENVVQKASTIDYELGRYFKHKSKSGIHF